MTGASSRSFVPSADPPITQSAETFSCFRRGQRFNANLLMHLPALLYLLVTHGLIRQQTSDEVRPSGERMKLFLSAFIFLSLSDNAEAALTAVEKTALVQAIKNGDFDVLDHLSFDEPKGHDELILEEAGLRHRRKIYDSYYSNFYGGGTFRCVNRPYYY